jgi:hypothetical protein
MALALARINVAVAMQFVVALLPCGRACRAVALAAGMAAKPRLAGAFACVAKTIVVTVCLVRAFG